MIRILVILTGGTIGSELKDEYISVNTDSNKYQIIELFKEAHPYISRETVFETICPYAILSENLCGSHINRLIDCIKTVSDDLYDGIIITHGTDTLQYSAAAIDLAFPSAKLPIIFVSSNYILNDERANGLDNFTLAVEYIKVKNTPGVYVSYDSQMLKGITLLPHIAYSDKLYSIDVTSDTDQNFFESLTDKNINDIKLSEDAPILYLKAVPGQIYPQPDNNKIKAILLETYHSGTLGTDNNSLTCFCEVAYKLNIPIYIVGVEERDQYESTSHYEKLHLHVLKHISPVTAYMKLWFLYSI